MRPVSRKIRTFLTSATNSLGRKRRILQGGLLAVLVIATVALLIGPLANLVGGDVVHSLRGKERADALNSVRQTLLQTAAGLAALGALAVTTRSYLLSRRGQFTDRYMKVVALLASEKPHERVGGVFAAEQLMSESEYDHPTLTEVLSSFVRNWPGHADYPSSERLPANKHMAGPRPDVPALPADIQAALTVLGRRPARKEPRRINLSGADLRGADLREANLREFVFIGAKLDDADLFGADLFHANLHHASLNFADLRQAVMTRAYMVDVTMRGAWSGKTMKEVYLVDADCSGANFAFIDLRDANVTDSIFYGATFWGSDLTGAHFNRVDMRSAVLGSNDPAVQDGDVKGFAADNVSRMAVDEHTKLPGYALGEASPALIIGSTDKRTSKDIIRSLVRHQSSSAD